MGPTGDNSHSPELKNNGGIAQALSRTIPPFPFRRQTGHNSKSRGPAALADYASIIGLSEATYTQTGSGIIPASGVSPGLSHPSFSTSITGFTLIS
jgi:hypothetical protein